MNKIVFVEIQVEGNEEPSAFAIYVNGVLVGVDREGRFLNEDAAASITRAVFGVMEWRRVVVPPDWDFDQHVKPVLGMRRHYPVVLDVEEDIHSMADGWVRFTRAGVNTSTPLKEMPSEERLRRAAIKARDTLLDLCYYDVLDETLREVLQEAGELDVRTPGERGKAAWPA
jgi:hypothetical protein